MTRFKYNENITIKTDFFGPETAIRVRVIDYNYADKSYRVSFERPDVDVRDKNGMGFVSGGLHNLWITEEQILSELGVLNEVPNE